MGRIAVVTDSTADLDSKLAAEHAITVVPLNVHFHEEVYKDGIDMTPEQFFAKLASSPVPPRTSQPSPGEFHTLFKSLLADGVSGIISIHLSKELSGTYQSAAIARDMLPHAAIQVVNGKSASMGTGIIALKVAQCVAGGASFAEAADFAEKLVGMQKVVFAVDTLEYLHRNGRIGRAAKLVGTMLNVKPLLHIDSDGFVAPLAKVRGESKVLPYLMDKAIEFAAGDPVDLVVVHAVKPDVADIIVQKLKERLKVRALYISTIGSVIGTHAGPGAVGIILQKG